MNERHDDLQEIIDAALREMAAEEGDGFDPQACNLAEFCRRTGLTRSRARTVRAHGFRALPHGNSGRRAAPGVLAGHTGLVDDLLRKGVTNSQVIFERLLGQGYAGGLTTVKTYIAAHRDLVPAKRRQAAPQGCRGQRFRTAPGEAYQMDWGFVAVERPGGERARIACFAMVCHHCGGAHVEFFPNARQENLLIGMLHAFSAPVLASIYFSPFSPTYFRQSRQRGCAGFANADAPLSASRLPPPSRPHRRWIRPSGGTTVPLS